MYSKARNILVWRREILLNKSRRNQSKFGQMEYFIHLEDSDLLIVRCLSPTSTLFAI